MAKKNSHARKPSGAAAIETVDDGFAHDVADTEHESNGSESHSATTSAKTKRAAKAKAEPAAEGSFGVGDIKKGAAFVNSIGGLEKAIAVLQILKVAKEVQ